jgi:hypothetical protein
MAAHHPKRSLDEVPDRPTTLQVVAFDRFGSMEALY